MSAARTLPSRFDRALRLAWSADTTFKPDAYEGKHPSTGQCGVTAIAIWVLTGAPLRASIVGGEAHYFNEGIDITTEQFEPGEAVAAWTHTTVESILWNDWFIERARVYLFRVASLLAGNPAA